MEMDQHWMVRALEVARQGWGTTHPNPMVGAVIVEDGREIASGYHARAGGPHAERTALDALGRPPRPGATLYITLEPCSTAGRTPPCTDAILASGVRRVVIGATDPNPLHAGRGIELLREAGIEVRSGICAEDCTDLNLIFNHWITRPGSPLVALKLALSLDGAIATRTGDSRWITGVGARDDVARWRRYFPAIAVGAETVLRDDPALTSRIPGKDVWSPRRFVIDSQLRTLATRPQARIFQDEFRHKTTLVAVEGCPADRMREAEEAGLALWLLPPDATGRVDLREFLTRCGERDICGVWLEGGATLANAFLQQQLVHYLFAYTAPIIFGDSQALRPFQFQSAETIGEALRIVSPRFSQMGDDRLLRGYLRRINK